MAIDFSRVARGVATGYLQAKIRNTEANDALKANTCLLYTSPSPRDVEESRMPSSA